MSTYEELTRGTKKETALERKQRESDEFLAFIEHYLNMVGKLPSIERLLTDFPQLSKQKLEAELKLARIKLQMRGYELSTRDYLEPLQLAVANALLNLSDRRSRSKKLQDFGVSAAQFANWKKNPVFNAYLRQRSEDMLGHAIPDVHLALIDAATAGDVSAMKLFYEITGRHGVDSRQTTNVQAVLVGVIEAVQTHIKDPVLLQKIANTIQEVSGGLSPVIQGELEK